MAEEDRVKERKSSFYFMIKIVVLTLCTTLALTMDFSPSQTAAPGFQTIYIELLHGFGGTSFITTLLWGMFLYISFKNKELKIHRLPMLLPVCFMIAIIWVMGQSFQIDNTLNALSCSYVQLFKTFIYVVGITHLLVQLCCLLKLVLDKTASKQKSVSEAEFPMIQLYRKHTFAASFALLAGGTLPQLIMSYPAGLSYDARLSLLYYFNLLKFSSHHPPFSTWLMGRIVSIGVLLGNSNVGIFLYCVLQYLTFSLISAYLIYTIRVHLEAARWLQILTMITFLVAPYHALYVGVMIKDVLYSYFLLLFIIEMVYYVRNDFHGKGHALMLCFSAIMTILLRNNGGYVIYPALLMLVILTVKRKNKKNNLRILLMAICIMFCAVSVESYLTYRYVEEQGSIREALSLPFQQTARYLKQYSNEVTDEEKQAIEAILDYEQLPELYDPLLSDPVKATFRETATNDDLVAYLKVWLKQFGKHPWCYVEATVNQNYLLVYPLAETHAYFSQLIYDEPLYDMLVEHLDLHEVDSTVFQGLSTLQALYVWTALMWPGIGMLSNVGFYNLLLLFVILYAIKERYTQVLMMTVPLMLSVLIVVAAPYVGPRYDFPIMYSMPCIIALYMTQKREKNEQSLQNVHVKEAVNCE